MIIPVVILSYNRPYYLKQVLESIKNQKTRDNLLFEYYLFQDIPPHEDRNFGKLVNQCKLIFSEILSDGIVFEADRHQGIAFNYQRAEQYVFEERKFPFCFFLEDDFILNKNYFEILYHLSKLAINNSKIGTVTAIGVDHCLLIEEQIKNSYMLANAGFSWAFSLTRQHWLERKKYVDIYLKIIGYNRYQFRDSNKIWAFYSQLGFPKLPTSQDKVKSVITNYLGKVRLSTTTVNGEYIGAEGTHFTCNKFEERGFCTQQVIKDSDLTPLFFEVDENLIEELFLQERERLLQQNFSLNKNQFNYRKSLNVLIQAGFDLPEKLVIKSKIYGNTIQASSNELILNYKGLSKDLSLEVIFQSKANYLLLIIINLDDGKESYHKIYNKLVFQYSKLIPHEVQIFLFNDMRYPVTIENLKIVVD